MLFFRVWIFILDFLCCIIYVVLYEINACRVTFLLYCTYPDFLQFLFSCCIILTLPFFREKPPQSMLTPYDFPVFPLKQYDCKQVEMSADFLYAFDNFKSFCSTWMVLAPFSIFSSLY